MNRRKRNEVKIAVMLIVAMVCLVSSTGFASEVRSDARKAILTEVRGDVEVRIAEGEWKPASTGMILHEKDQIRTLNDGFAEILLDEGGSVGKLELKANSLLRLNVMTEDAESGDKITLLDLAIGKVLVHAEKLKGDSKFEVKTPTSTTGVRGTTFEVAVQEK